MNADKAILVVSFGTSYNDNREKTIGSIEKIIAERFPEWDVRRAFTSKMIIKKLKESDGEYIDYIDEALERLSNDGVSQVIVQPTHVMNGIEYDFVKGFVEEYSDRFDSIVLGEPLLTTSEDYDEVVEAIRASILEESREIAGDGAAVVLMGHGTEHYANATYSQLQLKLILSGIDNVFVTTVEGFPEYDDTISLMEGRGFKDVVLFPFMLVAGDHANNDMAGDEEDSLKNVLSSKGYNVHCVLKGLGEIDEFRELFVNHVNAAIEGQD